MLKVIARGNLTTDVTIREVSFGSEKRKVCDFGLATNENCGAVKQTTYLRVHAWAGLAEVCAQYLSKGRSVLIVGTMTLNKYKDANGETQANLDLRADEIEFIDSIRR